MTTLASKIGPIQAALDTLARQHKVPGASLGIMHGTELVEFATGVANRNTGVPVTTSTLFQIGSNTKVLTATLVMQLVDDGLVDLDAPVRKYLPTMELADRKARDVITVRHLLTHTSGIEGDWFEDFGRGDDGLEKVLANLGKIGTIYKPGEMWSYCNTGWNVLGRLIEVVRGEPYHKVLKDRLFAPLGMATTTVLMEDMLAHSCAVGHVPQPGSREPVVPPNVMMSPSHAPAGSMTVSTPGQLLRFVRMHLDGGRARDGTQVLSEESVKAMQQPQTKLPFIPQLGTEMGLGWMLAEWDGERVIGHGGNTIGQASSLKVLPDRRIAICLFTNSAMGGLLWRDLARYLFSEIANVHTPEMPKVPAEPPKLDLGLYAGTYSRYGLDVEVKLEKKALVASLKASFELSDPDAPPQTARLAPVDRDIFIMNLAGEEQVAHFLDFGPDGRPKYVHFGARVNKRTAARAKSKAKPKRKAKPKAKSSRRR